MLKRSYTLLQGRRSERQTGCWALPALRHPTKKAKLRMSLQDSSVGELTEAEAESGHSMSGSDFLQRLSPMPATMRQQHASMQEVWATRAQLHASITELETIPEEAEFESTELSLSAIEVQRRQAGMFLYGDQAAPRLQALQYDGRRRALAHVGIYDSAIARDGEPYGDRIGIFVDHWAITCQMVLTPKHIKKIVNCFGSRFMSFLGSSIGVQNTTLDDNPRHTLSLSMPLAERCFIMEAIDNLQPEAVRLGGRTAYMAFLRCKSWEDEWRTVHQL